jgi:anaerobic magnesium-protoporphyrin IX monomethyl ester cyclase
MFFGIFLIRQKGPVNLVLVKTIVLVNPPYSFWSPEKNYLRPFIGTLPSLGLLSLGAVLRARGYPVKIVESASLGLSFSQTLEYILQEKPSYVGLSCTTAAVDNAAGIARAVKGKSPETLIFVGGPHITALPGETFRRYPVFDYGVVGEGEMAFLDLLEAVEGSGKCERVESAVFRSNGEVYVNPRRRFIENLDQLPFPAYDLLPFFPSKYHPPFLNYLKGPAAPLASSRGCPQVCTFCDRSVFGNQYRYFSEEYLLELISHLHQKYRIQHLVFADDQFAASKPRLIRFCERLVQKNFRIRWNCDARVDSVDPELLKIMRRAGCWMISYGIESGSQEILDNIQKGFKLEQVERAVRWTKEAGIRAKGLFMIGYPEETEETVRQTLSLLLRCPLDEMNLSFLTPYPGTKIYQQAGGSSVSAEDWGRMNAMNPLLKPEALAEGVLEKAHAKMIRRFYMRPGITFSYLGLLMRSPENCTRLVDGLARWLLTR